MNLCDVSFSILLTLKVQSVLTVWFMIHVVLPVKRPVPMRATIIASSVAKRSVVVRMDRFWMVILVWPDRHVGVSWNQEGTFRWVFPRIYNSCKMAEIAWMWSKIFKTYLSCRVFIHWRRITFFRRLSEAFSIRFMTLENMLYALARRSLRTGKN